MPKIGNPKGYGAGKPKKQKLTPAERSQIAKDRWAKRRKDGWDTAKIAREVVQGVDTSIAEEHPTVVTTQAGSPPPVVPNQPIIPQNPTPEQPPVAPESIVAVVEDRMAQSRQDMEEKLLGSDPAPQLAPVAPKKQKRYTGPKEFSVALKAAEGRLAKAIVERAELTAKLAGLQAEIPSLLGIINALKGSGNYVAPAAYDFPGGVSAQAFQASIPQVPQAPMDLQAILHAAQPSPPVFKSTGGAMQFSPDVVGTLEGPDDDDNPDKFIHGEHAGNSGWIGG